MKQVKLIIANTQSNTIFFNYGDDYNDITRILIEDHSPWEEVDNDEVNDILDFVNQFNIDKNRGKSFAFLIIKDDQMSAKSAIKIIHKKREKEKARLEEENRKRYTEAQKRKEDIAAKKLAKTREQKLKLIEQLKKELGE